MYHILNLAYASVLLSAWAQVSAPTRACRRVHRRPDVPSYAMLGIAKDRHIH